MDQPSPNPSSPPSSPARPLTDDSTDGFHLIRVSRPHAPPPSRVTASPMSPCISHRLPPVESPRAPRPSDDLSHPPHSSHSLHATASDPTATHVQVQLDNAQLDAQTARLTEWVSSALATEQRSGISFSETVRRNSNFRNPAIYDKMVSFCAIDEFATHIAHRKPLEKFEYYDDLNDLQELLIKDTASL